MGVGQLIRNVVTTETDPTVANFTKSLTSNNTILTAVNAASGTISASVLPSYVDDVLNFATLQGFPAVGETGKIYVTEDNNKTYRWTGTVYVEISSAATADTALKLTNARTISTTGDATYSVSFDGSANVSSAITLANTGVAAGTYNALATQVRPFTVDAKGRITGVGTPVDITPPWSAITGKPTTLNGYGITDALPSSGGTVTGATTFSNATPSTSTTTGAVVVSGGVGVGGAIFAGSYNLIPVGRGGGNASTNTVMGVSAGLSNTTGSNNSFVGLNAGQSNTTGNFNSCVGVSAGRSNTTGNSNSFLGVNAGIANTTGNSNSFLGVNAGRFIADGVTELTVINNSCFFGMNTKGTENAINENVFGYNATGNGSNTVTIGDNNITNTYLKGVVSTNSTATSTSTTTGAIRAASLGITGAIFAGSLNGNGSGLTSLNASNISIGNMPYQRINATENTPPINDSSPPVGTVCNMGVSLDNGYPVTGHLFSSVVSSIRGIQVITNPLAPEFSYIRSRHTNFTTGWSPWLKIATENTSGIIPSSSGFSVGNNQVVSDRRTGWAAPTGTATRTTFATSTVTLPQLAERVKALIDDLTTHGLIGA